MIFRYQPNGFLVAALVCVVVILLAEKPLVVQILIPKKLQTLALLLISALQQKAAPGMTRLCPQLTENLQKTAFGYVNHAPN